MSSKEFIPPSHFPLIVGVGEVERLLKEYRQNQELVRKIGGNFYQIIYPVQLRHHEKMGISTREVGGSKVWSSLGKRNIMNSTVCHYHHLFLIFMFSLFILDSSYLCNQNYFMFIGEKKIIENQNEMRLTGQNILTIFFS